MKEWEPPAEGLVKINFNGSSIGNPGLAGFGCVARDSHGRVLFVVLAALLKIVDLIKRSL